MVAYRKLVQGHHVDPAWMRRVVDGVVLPLLGLQPGD
jgi:hypothetical protein